MKNGFRGKTDHTTVGIDSFPRKKSKEDYVYDSLDLLGDLLALPFLRIRSMSVATQSRLVDKGVTLFRD